MLRPALGCGGHTTVKSSIMGHGAPREHSLHIGLLNWPSAVSCVLHSLHVILPFLDLSIHQLDDTLKTKVSLKSCSPLCSR